MSKWLSSTNAKEIGTLYLVFAVFAGIQKITIMLALYLAICWETLLKLNIKPVYTVLELGKILYLKGLSAVNFILRDFTQDNLSLEGVSNTSYNNNFNINSKDTCSNTNIKSINTNSVLTPQSPKVKIGLCQTTKMHSSNLATNPTNNTKQNNRSSQLGNYLAGLIEGYGTIVVPKTERSAKDKINYPSIQIVFHLKDLPLALMIQKELKNGSLSRKKGVNAYILTINNLDGLLLVTSLINGNMRTPKIYALYYLIDWLNLKFEINIPKKSLNNSPLNSNAWLSGFIEADGHFSVRITTSSKYPKVECKFELSQRQNDHNNRNNLEFLEAIAIFLVSSVKAVRVNKPNPEYRVRTTSLKGNLVLEDYLSKFPLFSSKYLDYKNWIKVLDYFKSGRFDQKSNIENIISIKSCMNDRRTVFSWDHLGRFHNLD